VFVTQTALKQTETKSAAKNLITKSKTGITFCDVTTTVSNNKNCDPGELQTVTFWKSVQTAKSLTHLLVTSRTPGLLEAFYTPVVFHSSDYLLIKQHKPEGTLITFYLFEVSVIILV
jgi:hypothetical protein